MLVLLSLLSTVTCNPLVYLPYSGLVPQTQYSPSLYPYMHHPYAVVPQVATVPQAPVIDPQNYAIVSAYPIPEDEKLNARLITVTPLQTAAGTFMEHAAGTDEIMALMDTTAAGGAALASTATTVRGNIEFQQNPLTGQMSTFKAYLNGAGIMANMKYRIGVGNDQGDCVFTSFIQIQEVTAPFFLLNGFYVKGATNTVNIDAMGGLPSVRGRRVMVVGPGLADTVIGCTEARLV